MPHMLEKHVVPTNRGAPPQITSWEFNVVEVDRLSGRRPLRTVLMHILELEGLLVRPAQITVTLRLATALCQHLQLANALV